MFFWPKEPSPLGSELSLASVQNHRATLTTWKKKVNSSGILGASLQNSPITTTVGKLLDVEFFGNHWRIIEDYWGASGEICVFAIGESFVHSWLIDGFLFDEWFQYPMVRKNQQPSID